VLRRGGKEKAIWKKGPRGGTPGKKRKRPPVRLKKIRGVTWGKKKKMGQDSFAAGNLTKVRRSGRRGASKGPRKNIDKKSRAEQRAARRGWNSQ